MSLGWNMRIVCHLTGHTQSIRDPCTPPRQHTLNHLGPRCTADLFANNASCLHRFAPKALSLIGCQQLRVNQPGDKAASQTTKHPHVRPIQPQNNRTAAPLGAPSSEPHPHRPRCRTPRSYQVAAAPASAASCPAATRLHAAQDQPPWPPVALP